MLEIFNATDIFTDFKECLLSNMVDMMLGPENETKSSTFLSIML